MSSVTLCDLHAPRRIVADTVSWKYSIARCQTWEEARKGVVGFAAEIRPTMFARERQLAALLVDEGELLLHCGSNTLNPADPGSVLRIRKLFLFRVFEIRKNGKLMASLKYFHPIVVDPFGPDTDDFFEYVCELSRDGGFGT
jgi:hypothetical protein